MQPHDPGLRLAVGVSRSGKTYGMRGDVLVATETIPVMVLDRLREWRSFPASAVARTCIVSSVERGIARAKAGKRLIVVQTHDVAADATAACAWARDFDGVAGVAVSEAHRAWPNGGRLPEPVEDVVCAWRHHRAALWADTQRLAKVHKDLTEQASSSELRLYAITGVRDRAVIADELDRELLAPLEEICRRWAGGEGERGLHVRLPSSRPYQIVRG